MKILKVSIQNFKSIEDLNKDLDGRSLWVLAKNGAGKTSFIQAIFSALTGKGFPLNPLTVGEKKGEIEIEVGNPGEDPKFIVTVKYSDRNKAGSLSVTSLDGEKYPTPRAFLNKVVGDITFDPFELLRLTPAKMVEKVKQLAGLDFAEIDEEYDVEFKKRAEANKEIARYKGLLEKSGLTEADFTKYKDEINVKELLTRKEEINEAFREEEKLRETKKQVDEKVARSEKEGDKISEEIRELEDKITKLKEEQVTSALNITSARRESEEAQSLIEKKEVANKPLLDEKEKIEKQLEEADEHNRKYLKVVETKQSRESLRAKNKEAESLTDKLTELKEKKAKMIEESSLPVEGLTFEDDGLYLDGLPFDKDQINTAKIMEVGYKLSVALHKDLQVMRINAGELDDDTIKAFLEYVNKLNMQVFIEKVDSGKEMLSLEFIEED